MAIPNISASQIGQLIERLMDLLSKQNQGASGPQGDQGCSGNEQQEFQDIVNQIRSLGHQLESLEPGLFGNADSDDGRLNVRISV